MKKYNYTATDRKTGKTVKGTVQAESEYSVGRILLSQGYLPGRVTEQDQSGFFAKMSNKISTKQKIAFTRQFSTLMSAGLPLATALRMIADQMDDEPTKNMTEDLLNQVEGGKTLHDSMQKYPETFGRVYLSLVAAGEASGTLDQSLQRLAAQEEKDEKMRSDIRGAMTYPIICLLVIVAVIAFMMIMVIPQVENLYRDLGQELPTMTLIMVAISNFMMNFWWLILIILGFLIWFLGQYAHTESGMKVFGTLKLNFPLISPLFRRLYNARFARTAQILLNAGVPMLDAIEIASEAINNVVMEDQFKETMTMVRSGKPLSESLKERDYVLPLIPQMAATGEQSGQIDDMLGRAATVYENELDEKINAISTLIEPVLMIIMALMAAFIVGGVLFPIYNLVGSMGV